MDLVLGSFQYYTTYSLVIVTVFKEPYFIIIITICHYYIMFIISKTQIEILNLH